MLRTSDNPVSYARVLLLLLLFVPQYRMVDPAHGVLDESYTPEDDSHEVHSVFSEEGTARRMDNGVRKPFLKPLRCDWAVFWNYSDYKGDWFIFSKRSGPLREFAGSIRTLIPGAIKNNPQSTASL